MKKLIVLVALGALACAVSAEEKSFLSGLFSAEKEPVNSIRNLFK